MFRRLPIICLEDGALHPAFPILVWCMVASSKGYLLPDYLLATCVHIIAEVSESPYMDCLTARESGSDSAPLSPADRAGDRLDPSAHATPSIGSPARSSSLGPENTQHRKRAKLGSHDIRQQPASAARTLVLSIMLRTSFGGMACDIVMLKKYTSLWYNRFFSDQGIVDRKPTALLSPVLNDVIVCPRPPPSTPSGKLFTSTAEDMGVSNPSSTHDSSATPTLHRHTNPLPAAEHGSCPSPNLSLRRDMTVYMHHRWADCARLSESPWGKRCVESFARSQGEMKAARSNADSLVVAAAHRSSLSETPESATFSTLRQYIVACLREVDRSPLSLYSPHQTTIPGPEAACRAQTHLRQNLLLRTLDLVPEGIDYHCDSEIVRSVRDRYFITSDCFCYTLTPLTH